MSNVQNRIKFLRMQLKDIDSFKEKLKWRLQAMRDNEGKIPKSEAKRFLVILGELVSHDESVTKDYENVIKMIEVQIKDLKTEKELVIRVRKETVKVASSKQNTEIMMRLNKIIEGEK